MGCAHNKKLNGFTLVEISIVMIIIGLLIGGAFGGMKLIENMQVNKTVQDLKAIESAALTFKDTYGRLPGDMPNTAARLPNCTNAPCSTGGNGDRRVDAGLSRTALAATNERFTFWHHLNAAGLASVGVKGTTDLNFGEGQPDAPFGGGYRIDNHTGGFGAAPSYAFSGTVVYNMLSPDAVVIWQNSLFANCSQIQSADIKTDDGRAYDGWLQGWGCAAVNGGGEGDPLAPYLPTNTGAILYDLKGF